MAKSANVDLDDDRPFQDKFWSFQRVAWIVLALIVVAALAGLTGKGGPLSRTSVSGPDGKIVYPRLARWQATDQVEITLPAGASGEATVDIESSFGRIFQTEDIQPTPAENLATGFGQRLVFDLAGPGGEKTIVIHVRPLQPALTAATEVRINGGAPLRLTPIVLP